MSSKKKALSKKGQKSTPLDCGLYDVEAILKVENQNNVPMFRVKWVGWESKHNTWEPYEHVADVLKNLDNFEEIMKKTREIWRAVEREEGEKEKRLSNGSSRASWDAKRSKSKLTPPKKRFKGISNYEKNESSSSEDEDNDYNDDDDSYTPRKIDESKCANIPALERSKSPGTSSALTKIAKQPAIDFEAVEKMQYDKNLVADYIMGVIPNKETNKHYFVIKWKNPLKENVQIVYSKFANKYYPQTVIEFYESKLKFEN